jgi:hypothetical protein
MKQIRTLFQIFKIKIKELKTPIAVNVLFKAYPMVVPQSGWPVPLTL